MYIELYMPKSLYGEVLRRARADLGTAVGKRNLLLADLETVEKEIAQLKRLIGGVHAYLDESDKQDDLLFGGEGLKEAICTAFLAATQDATISDILSILKELQFPIETHQNPLGSIYTTVTRLVADGNVVSGEPRDGKKTYRWKRAVLAPAGARGLALVQAFTPVKPKATKKR